MQRTKNDWIAGKPEILYNRSFTDSIGIMMADYKDTLNLPQTDFPMKADLPQREPEVLKHWDEIDLYHQIQAQSKGRKTFILHDGPIYANGHTHIGHSANRLLKDIIVKSKTLNGYCAPFVPGWDCHGLPIELNVEKKMGKAGVQVSPQEFRQACRKFASDWIDIQREEFIRLGVLGEWQKPYTTMSHSYEANIIRSLGLIIENGHLIHGQKPVYWCVDCGSALAEAEVEYKDKKSPAIDVRFFVLDELALASRFGVHQLPENVRIAVPIWTTTPWTLPANQAVALNHAHSYVLVQHGHSDVPELLVIAEELLEDVMKRYNFSDYQVLASCPGKNLEGLKLQHPFLDREVPIVLGDHVTLDSGTGAVHTAPAHGQEDYMVGQHYHLPLHNPVDNRGCFYEDVPHFAGQHVFKANDTVIALLRLKNTLLHDEMISHSYPHCWRHKTPLIFRATPQWFISMEKAGLRTAALDAIKKVEWIPGWGKERLYDMIEKRPDWCISRQRVWGVPITLFVHHKTNHLHPNTKELIEKVAKRVEMEGIEVWDTITVEEMLGSDAAEYVKVTDTLDVWFDSGVSHACVLNQKDYQLTYPADLYLEGSDQHRGWFHTALLTSIAMYKTAPYKTVLTHGYTVDGDGHKMSKSLGNVISTEQAVKKMGADMIRLWISFTDYRGEMGVSDEIFKRVGDAYRRIRNTARFFLSNLYDFDPIKDRIAPDDMLSLDRWAVSATKQLQDTLIQEYEAFNFHNVAKNIQHFSSIDMGGFYLDIIKDRMYTCQKDGRPRRSAQTAMYIILQAFVRWLAPILSFTAEEIWRYMPGDKAPSVFLTTWTTDLFSISEEEAAKWQKIIGVRDEVNKALEASRNAGDIGSALAGDVVIFVDQALHALLKPLGEELRFVLITSNAEIKSVNAQPENSVATEIDGLWVQVNPSKNAKCSRCWHRRPDVGHDTAHPDICGRCIENVVGNGEERQFA